MKIVFIRLDLDRYDVQTIERLVVNGVVDMDDATDARAIKKMTDLDRLVWVRETLQARQIVCSSRFDKVS